MRDLESIMKLTVFIIAACLLLPMSVLSMETEDNQIMLGEGTFRIAMQDDLKTTNPLTASDSWTWNVLEWLYDEPMYIEPETGEVIPFIAIGSANLSTTIDTGEVDWADCEIGVFEFTPESEWGTSVPSSSIGEAIIFYDFTNVTFHDDVQMDIRDVMFSFHVAAQVPEWASVMNCLKENGGGAGSNYSSTSWLNIFKVWESGDHMQAALKFVLEEPYGDFFTDTLSPLVLPYHIWGYTVSGQDIDAAEIWCDPGYAYGTFDAWKLSDAQAYDNNPPIGSGPFEFDYWQVGQKSSITTWPDHFYKPGYAYNDYCLDSKGVTYARLAGIDAMEFKIYKTAEAAILALKNNDIDYIAWPVPPTFVQELSNEPGISLQFSPDPGFAYMAYNMRRESFGYDETKSFPYAPEDDLGKPLRQAISHCIDKEKIVDRLLLGLGVEGDGPVSPFSSWYNDSLPQYAFDPDEAKMILDNAGYMDYNGDGWRQNPDESPIGSGTGGLIEILTPEANYDPIRAQAGLMIAFQLQDIGIYANSVAMDFGSIINRIDARDFDMYILDWDIESQPPSYMYEYFHSSTAQAGQNYPAYMNESYDDVIDNATMTGNQTERLQHVKDAQASISHDLPIDVLYYRTNIEAYRSDRFVGWVVDEYGTIFNWQTILNLRKPVYPRLEAYFVSPPSAIESNSTNQITILVRDQNTTVPVEEACVKLDCTDGVLSVTEANTTSAGKVIVTFTAPYVPPDKPNGTNVIIEIEEATKDGYDPAPPEIILITVYPASVPYLSVSIAIDPDHIDDYDGSTYGFTYAVVTVEDSNGDPVENAIVVLSDSPNLLDISPVSALTGVDGEATFTITSPDLPDDDDMVDVFVIDVLANLTGYEDGHASANLWILDRDNTPTPVTEITAVSVNNILNTSARVVWSTDQPGDSTVNYSINSDLTSNTSIHSAPMTIDHAINLAGLTQNTTYYYEVSSSDDYGNWITDNNGSNYYMFTTLIDNETSEDSSTLPKIISCTPEGIDVPVNSVISISFDSPMNKSSVELSFSISPNVAGSFSWDTNGAVMAFTPSANLTKNTTYVILIDSSIAKDLNNNTLDGNENDVSEGSPNDDFSWSFTTWLDYDDDGLPDSTDPDDDNDGVPDDEDDFPLDETETTDTDGDGTGDNADDDDDNDGFLDEWEEHLGTDPLDDTESPLDTDGDGIPDGDTNNTESWMDDDDDNDGVPDDIDFDPLDPDVTVDPNASTGGGFDMLWVAVIAIIVIVGILGAAMFLKRTPTPLEPETALKESEQSLKTELCPECGFEIEAGSACPFCSSSDVSPEPESVVETHPEVPEENPAAASPEPKADAPPKLGNEEIIQKLEAAYTEGRITEEQYLRNMAKFKK